MISHVQTVLFVMIFEKEFKNGEKEESESGQKVEEKHKASSDHHK